MSGFAIWTVQRTGSTTLAKILEQVTTREVQHEPFNRDRQFSYHGDLSILQQHLQQLSSQEFCFKHCWNVHSEESNMLLLNFLLKQGYSVILLERCNVLAMEISRQLAKQTGVWAKKQSDDRQPLPEDVALLPFNLLEMKKKIKAYKSKLSFYRDWFTCNQVPLLEIGYEELFTGNLDDRLNQVGQVLRFLSVPGERLSENHGPIVSLLSDYKLNGSDMYRQIPNLGEIVRLFPESKLAENHEAVSTEAQPLQIIYTDPNSNTELILSGQGYLIRQGSDRSVWVQDEKGVVSPERFPWIKRFISIKTAESGFELVYQLANGAFAKWILDDLGRKQKYVSLEDKPFEEIAAEFSLNPNELSLLKLCASQSPPKLPPSGTGSNKRIKASRDLKQKRLAYGSFVCPARRYVYMETPKVACTKIKSVLWLIDGRPIREPWPGSVHERIDDRLSLLELDQQEMQNALAGLGWFMFCFVRNPYSRLYSAFKNKVQSNHKDGRRIRQAICEKFNLPSNTRAEQIEFRAFAEVVCNSEDEQRNGHWRSQTELLLIKDINYSFVGRFENFVEDFEYVLGKIDAPASSFQNLHEKVNVSHSEDWQHAYDDSLSQMVWEAYSQDFKTFGYEKL